MTRMQTSGPVRIVALVAGLVWPMTQAGLEQALSIGRASEAERARFHRSYVVAINDPTVEQIEIQTEFRRAVLFAEDRIRWGDHLFGVRQAEAALASWHGKLTIVARLRFHPMNTFIAAPAYEIAVSEPSLPPLDTRRTSLYAQFATRQKAGTPIPLTGALVEVDFDAQAVGQRVRPVRVVLEGKEVTRSLVDFARMQ